MAKRQKGKVKIKVGDRVTWLHDEDAARFVVAEIKKSDSDGTVAVIECGADRITVPITELSLTGEVA